ncbi:hypothetical protein GBA65_14900 [Rubrobacter marinus]|uniref:Uncharacterized protein n=1 Tax=Rubrobacter marinus TaxID=2653852 RepID=A0A6G8PZH9_9ACTN|nr:gene transfer agent family protein [Rubrobacter marinus]QIN79595.1 hypothetical protein GBA65_14900 [Rubrobacter marinus]
MANQERGERALKLGDKQFTLKFTTSSYCELEDVLDMEASEIERKFAGGRVGFRILRALIWAGTRKHHRQELRSLPQVNDIMDDMDDFQKVFRICTEAYSAGQPGAEDEDQDKPVGAPKGKKEKEKEPPA